MSAVVLCWHWLLFCQSKAASSLWFQAPSLNESASPAPARLRNDQTVPTGIIFRWTELKEGSGVYIFSIIVETTDSFASNDTQAPVHQQSVWYITIKQLQNADTEVFIGRQVPYIRWKQCQYLRKCWFYKNKSVFSMWKCFVKDFCIIILKSSSFRDGHCYLVLKMEKLVDQYLILFIYLIILKGY